MPRKRRETLAPEVQVPKRQKVPGNESVNVLKTRCQSVAEAIQTVDAMPLECKTLLLEAIPLTLGVPVKERDQRQVAVAGFIGEVLKEMETKLLQDLIDSKMASQEEVILAQLKALEAAERVQDARRGLEEAEEELALRLSDEDMTKVALNALRQRLNALEAAQAEARRQQRQAEEEQELSKAACRVLEADVSDGPALDIKAVIALCSKLDLEDSLRSTLPLILQKTHSSRSYLERAASKLICEALQSRCYETAAPAVNNSEEVSCITAEHLELEKVHQDKLHRVEEAQMKVQDLQCTLTKAQATETSALASLEDVKSSRGKISLERELMRLRKGALNAYGSLDGPMLHDDVELEEKIKQLDHFILKEARRRQQMPPMELPIEEELASETDAAAPDQPATMVREPVEELASETDAAAPNQPATMVREPVEELASETDAAAPDQPATMVREPVEELASETDAAPDQPATMVREPVEDTTSKTDVGHPDELMAETVEEPAGAMESEMVAAEANEVAPTVPETCGLCGTRNFSCEDEANIDVEMVDIETQAEITAANEDVTMEPSNAEAAEKTPANAEVAPEQMVDETHETEEVDVAATIQINSHELRPNEGSQELAVTEADEDGEDGEDGADQKESHQVKDEEWVEIPERPQEVSPTQRTESEAEGDVIQADETSKDEVCQGEIVLSQQDSFPETLPDSPQPEVKARQQSEVEDSELGASPEHKTRSPQSFFGYATLLLGLNGDG